MKLTTRLLSALAMLASVAMPALAADIDQIIPAPVIEDNYVPVEIGTGWYIRGDVGYNVGGRQNNQLYDLVPVTFDKSYADGLNVGVGFGYKFNDIFRMDTTFDRVFGSKFTSTQLVAPTGPCHGIGEYVDVNSGVVYLGPYDIDNCLRKDEASYNAWYMMGNAYADLGTFKGFTPFVGAGLGVAKINWKEETNSITCVPVDADVHNETCSALGTVAQPPQNTVYTEPGVLNNGSSWKLAMALTAGVVLRTLQGSACGYELQVHQRRRRIWQNSLWGHAGFQHRHRRFRPASGEDGPALRNLVIAFQKHSGNGGLVPPFLFVDNKCRSQTNFLTVCAASISRRDGPPFPNEGPLSGRIADMTIAKPGTRPTNPNFSSGPCAKRPGWSLNALQDAALGRSHRAKIGKNKLKLGHRPDARGSPSSGRLPHRHCSRLRHRRR